jgi:hypothetical protein
VSGKRPTTSGRRTMGCVSQTAGPHDLGKRGPSCARATWEEAREDEAPDGSVLVRARLRVVPTRRPLGHDSRLVGLGGPKQIRVGHAPGAYGQRCGGDGLSAAGRFDRLAHAVRRREFIVGGTCHFAPIVGIGEVHEPHLCLERHQEERQHQDGEDTQELHGRPKCSTPLSKREVHVTHLPSRKGAPPAVRTPLSRRRASYLRQFPETEICR